MRRVDTIISQNQKQNQTQYSKLNQKIEGEQRAPASHEWRFYSYLPVERIYWQRLSEMVSCHLMIDLTALYSMNFDIAL